MIYIIYMCMYEILSKKRMRRAKCMMQSQKLRSRCLHPKWTQMDCLLSVVSARSLLSTAQTSERCSTGREDILTTPSAVCFSDASKSYRAAWHPWPRVCCLWGQDMSGSHWLSGPGKSHSISEEHQDKNSHCGRKKNQYVLNGPENEAGEWFSQLWVH